MGSTGFPAGMQDARVEVAVAGGGGYQNLSSLREGSILKCMYGLGGRTEQFCSLKGPVDRE
jgi:hypothetical protein